MGFGWAKPVPVNPLAFRHPRKGLLLVSLAGPASNVALAFVAGMLLRLAAGPGPQTGQGSPLVVILVSIVLINLFLAFFNLIPIPPLDGGGVVSAILPLEYAQKYERFSRFGTLLILGLIVAGSFSGVNVIGLVIGPPTSLLFRLFTGL